MRVADRLTGSAGRAGYAPHRLSSCWFTQIWTVFELEEPMGRLALLLVGDIADDDGNGQIAFVGDRNAFGEALGALFSWCR